MPLLYIYGDEQVIGTGVSSPSTESFPVLIRKELAGLWNVQSKGYYGWGTSSLYFNYENDFAEYESTESKYLYLVEGKQDIGISPYDVNALNQFTRRMTNAGWNVILSTAYVTAGRWATPWIERYSIINHAIRNISQQWGARAYVDIAADPGFSSEGNPNLLDGIWPNAAGCQIIADISIPVIRSVWEADGLA